MRVDQLDRTLVLTLDTSEKAVDLFSAVPGFAGTATGKPTHAVIDLTEVNYLDSSGLGRLLEAVKRLKENNLEVVVCVSDMIRPVLELTRIDNLFHVVGSRDEAMGLIRSLSASQRDGAGIQSSSLSAPEGESWSPATASLSPQRAAHLPAVLSGAEVLDVSPFHRQVVEDLRWAADQYAAGRFDPYLGMYVAILDKKKLGVDYHVGRLLDRVTQANPEVPRQRIALFYVDPGEWN
jgi:hypothetical protein